MSISIVASSSQTAEVAAITSALHDRAREVATGSDIQRGSQQPDAAVVLVSQGCESDPGWQADFAGAGACRLVPVRVGPVEDALLLPPEISSLNWIMFDSADVGAVADAVVRVLNTDPAAYEQLRPLSVQAAAWVVAGYSPGLLIDVPKAQVRILGVLIDEAEETNLFADTNVLRAFVAAGAQATRSRRRRPAVRRRDGRRGQSAWSAPRRGSGQRGGPHHRADQRDHLHIRGQAWDFDCAARPTGQPVDCGCGVGAAASSGDPGLPDYFRRRTCRQQRGHRRVLGW